MECSCSNSFYEFTFILYNFIFIFIIVKAIQMFDNKFNQINNVSQTVNNASNIMSFFKDMM